MEYNADHADHGDDRVVDEEDGHLLRGEVSGLTRDVPVARQIPVRRVLYVRVHLNIEHFDDSSCWQWSKLMNSISPFAREGRR